MRKATRAKMGTRGRKRGKGDTVLNILYISKVSILPLSILFKILVLYF